jgi:hypothetical protein
MTQPSRLTREKLFAQRRAGLCLPDEAAGSAFLDSLRVVEPPSLASRPLTCDERGFAALGKLLPHGRRIVRPHVLAKQEKS